MVNDRPASPYAYKKMLAKCKSIEEIMELTNLSIEQLENIT